MLYNIETRRYVITVPHEQAFDIWKGRLMSSDLTRIQDAIADLFDQAEVRTSSWIPGKDWTDTAWVSIYDRACLQDEDLAARCFGLFVWEAAIQHPLVWAFGRYEKDGIPIEGLTYFRLDAPPQPPDDALALVRQRQ